MTSGQSVVDRSAVQRWIAKQSKTNLTRHITQAMAQLIRWLLMVTGAFFIPSEVLANDELTRSTWNIPTHEQIQSRVEQWLTEANVQTEIADEIRARWLEPQSEAHRLALLADCFAISNEQFRSLVELSRSLKKDPNLPSFEFLESSETLPFVRDNLRLLYARWLAQNQLYDETIERIGDLEPEAVVDPASLLFYQSVAYHRPAPQRRVPSGAGTPVGKRKIATPAVRHRRETDSGRP